LGSVRLEESGEWSGGVPECRTAHAAHQQRVERGGRLTPRSRSFQGRQPPQKNFCAEIDVGLPVAELRRKAQEAARARDRQEAAAPQNEAEESDATEEEETRERTTRRGRPRGGMKVAARICERLRREIGRGGRPRVGDG